MSEEFFDQNAGVKPKGYSFQSFGNVLTKYGLKDLEIEPLDKVRVKSLWLEQLKKMLASIGVKSLSFQEAYDPDLVQEILGLNYFELQELHAQSGQITVVLDPDRFQEGQAMAANDVQGRLKSLFSKETLEHPKLGRYLLQAKTWEDLRAVSIMVYEVIYIYYHGASVLKRKVIPREYEGMFLGHMTLFDFMMRLESLCEVSLFGDFGSILRQLSLQSSQSFESVTPSEAYKRAQESLSLIKFMQKAETENKNVFSDYLQYCHLKYIQSITSSVNWEQDPMFDLRKKLDLKKNNSLSVAMTVEKTNELLKEYSLKYERVTISKEESIGRLNKIQPSESNSISEVRSKSGYTTNSKNWKGKQKGYKGGSHIAETSHGKPSKNDLKYIRRKHIKKEKLSEKEWKLAQLYGLLDENSIEYQQAKLDLKSKEKPEGGLNRVLCLEGIPNFLLTENLVEHLHVPVQQNPLLLPSVTSRAILMVQEIGYSPLGHSESTTDGHLGVMNSEESQWVLFDCGASHHFIGDITRYKDVQRIIDPNQQLRVSFNGTVTCEYVGKVIVGHLGTHAIVIDNVWYIPGLPEMVISANELRDNDERFEVISDSQGLRIYYNQLPEFRNKPFVIRKIRNLEYVNFDLVQETTGRLTNIVLR